MRSGLRSFLRQAVRRGSPQAAHTAPGERPGCTRRLCASPLHEGVDVLGDVAHEEIAVVALDHVAVLVEQELLEVPRDVRAADRSPEGDGRGAECA